MKQKKWSEKKLRQVLESNYEKYHRVEFLKSDPLGVVHTYSDNERQIVALISALFSYGRAESIRRFLFKLFERLDHQPTVLLSKSMSAKEIERRSKGLVYRFYTENDIACMLMILNKTLVRYKSLDRLAFKVWGNDHLRSLREFQLALLNLAPQTSRGLQFMFSDPFRSSAKRWHMFMRWMVRRDSLDLGCWDFVSPSKLIMPMDVHVFSLSQHLGLCSQKTNSLKAAHETTESLRLFDSKDPVRFDFSLCRIGIMGEKLSFIEGLTPPAQSRRLAVK